MRVAKYTVTSKNFPLASLFENLPDATIELERVVPTNSVLIPYFWVRGVSPDDIDAAIRTIPEVASIRRVDEVDGESLIRVEWVPGITGVLRAIVETDVTLLSAVGTRDQWTFELRGAGTDALGGFQDQCREYGIPIRLVTLHSLVSTSAEAEFTLTDAQREALLLAYERGYYDTPKQTTLEALGRELGITGQSVGSRLHRGTKRLIGYSLLADGADGAE